MATDVLLAVGTRKGLFLARSGDVIAARRVANALGRNARDPES